jgi:hypothetical protein
MTSIHYTKMPKGRLKAHSLRTTSVPLENRSNLLLFWKKADAKWVARLARLNTAPRLLFQTSSYIVGSLIGQYPRCQD